MAKAADEKKVLKAVGAKSAKDFEKMINLQLKSAAKAEAGLKKSLSAVVKEIKSETPD